MVIMSSRSFIKTRRMSKALICANPNCKNIFYVYKNDKIIKYCPECYKTKSYLNLYKK